jgi:hypothetical protein
MSSFRFPRQPTPEIDEQVRKITEQRRLKRLGWRIESVKKEEERKIDKIQKPK